MGTEQGLIALVGLVENTKTAIEGATSYSKAISGNIYSANSALVLSFHQELIEVKSPDTKVLILRTCHTEGLID